jgi:hypothetical protein
MSAAQNSVLHEHQGRDGGTVPLGTACAFLGCFRGLELVPAKRRYLVPPTSPTREEPPREW